LQRRLRAYLQHARFVRAAAHFHRVAIHRRVVVPQRRQLE
jgi:hypothetical protein